MPAYNFQARFADLVESGAKRQTMRKSARGAAQGRPAYLFTGMRTKNCRRLGWGVITHVSAIEIREADGAFSAILYGYRGLAEICLKGADFDEFARQDGFNDGNDLMIWLDKNYKSRAFSGCLIEWV